MLLPPRALIQHTTDTYSIHSLPLLQACAFTLSLPCRAISQALTDCLANPQGPYTALDPGTGSPQTGKRTWISSSAVTNHTAAPEICKARQGLLPRPLLCDGCRAPCPKLGFPSHPEKDPYPWTGLIPSRLGQISEGIIPTRGGGASRRTNHHPRESSRWVLNGLASWKRTETKVRARDSIVDSPQELPLTLS